MHQYTYKNVRSFSKSQDLYFIKNPGPATGMRAGVDFYYDGDRHPSPWRAPAYESMAMTKDECEKVLKNGRGAMFKGAFIVPMIEVNYKPGSPTD